MYLVYMYLHLCFIYVYTTLHTSALQIFFSLASFRFLDDLLIKVYLAAEQSGGNV